MRTSSIGGHEGRCPIHRASGPGRTLSRRVFGKMATAAAFALAAGLSTPARAWAAQADGSAPRPLPGGVNTPWGVFIHHYPPKPGGDLAAMDEPSQITDLDGVIADSRIFGMGTGTDTRTGEATRYPFMADMGLMQGTYVGEDGQRRSGTFAFV